MTCALDYLDVSAFSGNTLAPYDMALVYWMCADVVHLETLVLAKDL